MNIYLSDLHNLYDENDMYYHFRLFKILFSVFDKIRLKKIKNNEFINVFINWDYIELLYWKDNFEKNIFYLNLWNFFLKFYITLYLYLNKKDKFEDL